MKRITLCALGILTLAFAASAAGLQDDKSAKPGPLTGSWDCISHGGPNGERKFTLDLQQDSEKVTGTVASDEGGMDITSATFKGDALEIRLETPDGTYVLTGKLKDGQLAGAVTFEGKDNGTWEGKKAAAAKSGGGANGGF